MEDTYSYVKPQRLGSQLVPPNHANPNKFHSRFMYKVVLTAIFLVVLPLLPTHPPEFINQTLHTRSWELFQLLFVGIAVSYGLFSRRTDETGEHSSKFDTVHSFVSKFVQISSVFDDEVDSPSGYDENKVRTWNSQHYRGEPVVVIAEESTVLEEQRGDSSQFGEKRLFLPIRSLKSRVSDSEFTETTNESSGRAGSLGRSGSNLGSKRFSNTSNKSRNVGFGGSSPLDLEEEEEENVLLCSPIPWRSRSGRMEIKQEMDDVSLFPLPPSMEDSEFNHLESRSFRYQASRSSQPNSTFLSPSLSSRENPSHSPSFSTESQAKNVEELARKKVHYKSSPPPAPPPPLSVPKPPLVNTKIAENFSGEEEKQEFIEDVIVETDEDSEIEDDLFEEGSDNEEVASNSVANGGPDVNKKAEEFIAKFREQIRLQRKVSIKRSTTGQIARNSSN